MKLVDMIIHRWLRVPYTLSTIAFRQPKKPVATVVLLHGIGNSAKSWEDLAPLLPKNVRVIGVDLLGFGKSPKPKWAKYNTVTQAKSVAVTLLRMGLQHKPIVVGHSMGSLVAIEVARRYPLAIKQLVLCSPPLYMPKRVKALVDYDELLRELYRVAIKRPQLLEKLSPVAVKLGFANRALSITSDTVEPYLAALQASIINQQSVEVLARLRLPITIVYGSLDPVVIGANIKEIAKKNSAISVKTLLVGHEIIGAYTKSLAKILTDLLSGGSESARK